MSCIFISTIAVVLDKFRDWVLWPFLECWRLIFFKFRANFRHIIKWRKPLFICISMQTSISSMKNFSFSLVIKFDRWMDIRNNTFQTWIQSSLIVRLTGFRPFCECASCRHPWFESSIKRGSVLFPIVSEITTKHHI